MASLSLGSTWSVVWPGNWAPAVEALPPPPSISLMTWTFRAALDRADRQVWPSSGKRTKEASMPAMFSSSSAARAAMGRPTRRSVTAMAMASRYRWASWMMRNLATVSSRSFWKNLLTWVMSAPFFRR